MPDSEISTGQVSQRLLKAEWLLDSHERLLKDFEKETKQMAAELNNIRDNLLHIKYFVIGATAFYIADSVGLTSALKLMAA